MFDGIKKRFSSDDREIRRLQPLVARINALEPEMQNSSDEALRQQTVRFRERLANGEQLNDLLPEAFATVREAAWRTVGMRPFDVQLLGGIVLHEGKIAEMKTGEGKTLVATLPAYLNALEGKGVHIVTVNDYLAKRDSEWMGEIYKFLGMQVGLNIHDTPPEQKQAAYRADITYGTNNEFGFDYLRDNMVVYAEQMVQRPLHYAIVDEVDSILIDEARTPLIISGQAQKSTDMYYKAAAFAKTLHAEEDYTIDAKTKTVALTDQGVSKAERYFGIENLFDPDHFELNHFVQNALKAQVLMQRDRDYVVKDGEVIIVDEFTGRLMFGRRYSDGLHQAIEAKEGVEVQNETQTLATITFQNYFRMYHKLAGMTGTAKTEEEEFRKIYGLEVVIIPTNRPMIRTDEPDMVYKTEAAKFRAVVKDIREHHEEGQPVLVGTTSIEKSEHLSALLKKAGIPHQVLNAKYHEQEAQIVAQAGRLGMVTIATNMAGRGTDIVLGGNPEYLARQELADRYPPEILAVAVEHTPTEDPQVLQARERYQQLVEKYKQITDEEAKRVVELGGLYIIGTERHEARRIDNQLRGRAGRQGDPGKTRFYLSLEDDLMKRFGADRIAPLLDRLGLEEDEPIEDRMVTRAIESAQRKMEANNFEARRQVLNYDDVMNQQREVIYKQRREVIGAESLRPIVMEMVEAVIDRALDTYMGDGVPVDEWDLQGLLDHCHNTFLDANRVVLDDFDGLTREEIKTLLLRHANEQFDAREAQLGPQLTNEFCKMVVLRAVDTKWMAHIDAMDDLRDGIGLRAYGQRDPLVEYRLEGSQMFDDMIASIQEEVATFVFKAVITLAQPAAPSEGGATATASVEQEVAQPVGVGVAAQPAVVSANVTSLDAFRRRQVGEPSAQWSAEGEERAQGAAASGRSPETAPPQPVRNEHKIGRNDPCWCGSGKKYKYCHGRVENA
ncbi:MAG: preprotein translocase subunit SecA [Firmicutes bacterium]|nr:preprotein translocase subunit SecA [Bacillota bacterium]